MGIRFLVSPITKTTSRMDEIEPRKRIIRSLLSGIHIGLFCGFVGAGGGVLLLITLTSVLGYSLKTAVGTSTFIMTFTALTGAVSHVIIGGTVNVPALVICVVAALVGARASALFANKVDAKYVAALSDVEMKSELILIQQNGKWLINEMKGDNVPADGN